MPRLIWPGSLAGILGPLMIACAPTGGSATSRAICAELRADLPTWSTLDTEQSRLEGVQFLDTFAAVCS